MLKALRPEGVVFVVLKHHFKYHSESDSDNT